MMVEVKHIVISHTQETAFTVANKSGIHELQMSCSGLKFEQFGNDDWSPAVAVANISVGRHIVDR